MVIHINNTIKNDTYKCSCTLSKMIAIKQRILSKMILYTLSKMIPANAHFSLKIFGKILSISASINSFVPYFPHLLDKPNICGWL